MTNPNNKISILMTEGQKERLKEKKLRNFRLWVNKENLKGQNIIYKINDDKEYIKTQKDILNDEEQNQNKQYKFEKKLKKLEGIIPSNIMLSKMSRNALTDAYEKINYMKEYTNYWEKENGIRLQKTTSQFCKGRPYSTDNNFNNLPSPELINKLYYNSKKHIKKINYIRYNDCFRRDINKAFQKYNPDINLQHLKKLRNENNEVKKEFEEINNKINKEIEERKKGDYYKKKYKKLINMYQGEKINNTKMSKTRSTNFNSLNNTKNTFNMKKKKKIDFKEKELDLMENALEPLFSTLEIQPIIKYIDDTYKDKTILSDKNILYIKEKDYFPKLAETERAIQKIHLNKINIESERNLDNTLQKVNDDQMNLLKGLENSKELLLSDISINDRNFSK